ncbi:MAG: response regulator [Xenococcaceae cyanobacterium MO_167.B27]|nr:response regulator [Xenococcaceae cyanobacterium MO_167.B27]
MIRILIVDDQKSIRETLAIKLQIEPDLEVVGTAKDGYDAIKQVKRFQPDVILVDLEMPSLDGVTLTRIIQKDFTGIKVIILSMHAEDKYINQSLQAGAMGYLLKNTPANELKAAIRFVYRGYAQFGPGLLNKVTPFITSEPVTPLLGSSARFNPRGIQPLSLDKFDSLVNGKHPPRDYRKNWTSYLPYWLGGNILLWTIAILYLTFKSPVYTSKWVISLPTNNNNSLSITDINSVRSNKDSSSLNSVFDPRENYKYLLRNKETIQQAAHRLSMNRSEFGKPEVKILDNTTMMELSIKGDSPREAQKKAIALQESLEHKLDELRHDQISQIDTGLQKSLRKSEQNLKLAREKLSAYKANVKLGYGHKVDNLSFNLESLRRQKVELAAQSRQAQTRVEQLSKNLGISSQLAKDAFALHSDSLFQKYLREYTQSSGELISFESRFQPNNPQLIDKREKTQALLNALLERGKVVLGKNLSPELLQQLSLQIRNHHNSYQSNLLQEIVALQSETKGLEALVEELGRHIAQLDEEENSLIQQESLLKQLEQELKFAESIYSSNLAQLRIAESNLYHVYPQIQVAIEPNVPREPSEPNSKLTLVSTLVSSLFLTTAIAFVWLTSTEIKPQKASNHNHKAIAPNSMMNTLIRK